MSRPTPPPDAEPVTPDNFRHLEVGQHLYVFDRLAQTHVEREVVVTEVREGSGGPHVVVFDPEDTGRTFPMLFYPQELAEWCDVWTIPAATTSVDLTADGISDWQWEDSPDHHERVPIMNAVERDAWVRLSNADGPLTMADRRILRVLDLKLRYRAAREREDV